MYAENAPDESSRAYVYQLFQNSSMAITGLEKALSTLGLLEQAKNVDLRNPYQDFFDPIWNHGWRASELIDLTERTTTAGLSETPQDGSEDEGVA